MGGPLGDVGAGGFVASHADQRDGCDSAVEVPVACRFRVKADPGVPGRVPVNVATLGGLKRLARTRKVLRGVIVKDKSRPCIDLFLDRPQVFG